jgi:exopolysaccharide biosynthesis polyprenyl glycosylphosphotransferase
MSRATYEPPSSVSPGRAVLATGNIAREVTRPAPRVVPRAWRGAYVRRVVAADVVCALVAAAAGLATPGAPLWAVAAAVPLVWVLALATTGSYGRTVLCDGPDEFRRVLGAAGLVLAGTGLVAWAAQQEISRAFVALTLPLAAVLTLIARTVARHLLCRARTAGRHTQTTLLVGHGTAVALLHEQLTRQANLGYQVVGCCLPSTDEAGRALTDVPVLGDLTDVVDVVQQYGVDTVAVLPSTELDGPTVRRLGWELEKTRTELLLAPAVTDIGGPRMRMTAVSGLPLLHVSRLELRGVRRVAKAVFDRIGAAALLLLIAPALLTLAVAVKTTSTGPVLFRQRRVGRDGQVFAMLKLRTMEVGAERKVTELIPSSNGNGVLFKMRVDPRVTRVGRFLRRYSLDELPQLINVLKGEMSLVGPRPPLPSEVEKYGPEMRRRFLVKPGLTGLWQVSGRSDLSWEESVRVDVHYVENWSLFLDLVILWRTGGAVIRGKGAY